MTRRGSIAYYLTAWICGSFFVSLAVLLRDLAGARSFAPIGAAVGLLVVYFFALACGLMPSLLGAFLLRRSMAALHWISPWQWILAGAVLEPALLRLLAIPARFARFAAANPGGFSFFYSYGPATVVDAGWWLAVPAGAATAYLLLCIQRAFAPKPSAQPSGA